MNKNFKSFFKNIFLYKIMIKVTYIFIIGFVFRFIINNGYNINVLINSILLITSKYLIFSDALDNCLNLRSRDRILNPNLRFKDKCRRILHWKLFYQFESKYASYEQFKLEWDNKFKLSNKFKDKYSDIKHKITVFKKTLNWFLNSRNR